MSVTVRASSPGAGCLCCSASLKFVRLTSAGMRFQMCCNARFSRAALDGRLGGSLRPVRCSVAGSAFRVARLRICFLSRGILRVRSAVAFFRCFTWRRSCVTLPVSQPTQCHEQAVFFAASVKSFDHWSEIPFDVPLCLPNLRWCVDAHIWGLGQQTGREAYKRCPASTSIVSGKRHIGRTTAFAPLPS